MTFVVFGALRANLDNGFRYGHRYLCKNSFAYSLYNGKCNPFKIPILFSFQLNFCCEVLHSQNYCRNSKQCRPWPRGHKTFSMLNSAEHEIYRAHKS